MVEADHIKTWENFGCIRFERVYMHREFLFVRPRNSHEQAVEFVHELRALTLMPWPEPPNLNPTPTSDQYE